MISVYLPKQKIFLGTLIINHLFSKKTFAFGSNDNLLCNVPNFPATVLLKKQKIDSYNSYKVLHKSFDYVHIEIYRDPKAPIAIYGPSLSHYSMQYAHNILSIYRLEGAMKEIRGFKENLFVEIEVR